MDEHLNNRQKELWHNLLANPANTGSVYLSDLQELVRLYPQSGLLRALYGHAQNEKDPLAAGAYFDGAALHKLYYHSGNLLPVSQEQVVLQNENHVADAPSQVAAQVQETPPVGETKAEPVFYQPDTDSDILTDQPPGFPDVLNAAWVPKPEEELVITAQPEMLPDVHTTGPGSQQVTEPEPEQAANAGRPGEEELVWPPLISDEPVNQDEAIVKQTEAPPAAVIPEAPEALPAHTAAAALTESTIEDEVFEEITGIDEIEIVPTPAGISAEQVAPEEAFTATEDAKAAPTAPAENQELKPAAIDEAEKLMLGNIAATNYFVFDRAYGGHKKPAEENPGPASTNVSAQQAEPVAEESNQQHDVSKYHDEKMPYTFMWWLDKTRKEHDNQYQPYTKAPVNSPARKPVTNELQQQYIENIFHISSIDELESTAAAQTIEFDMQSKEDRIIQRFITQDPQIHPPAGEKLDTENKAKKSSEDSDQMVTETLARIYADQMLYPKAIATYQKLMLKFPEKSRYFASRIENLEKKTNQ